MSINFPNADFTPQLVGYTGQGAFRFWCQKVLPIVYDDSLSYYELLNKVVDYLNKEREDILSVISNINTLNDSYNSLQEYVNTQFDNIEAVINEFEGYIENYFNSLDVQEEINNKLDEMASSGELANVVEPIVGSVAPSIIEQWLNDHIGPTSPPLDKTLSVENAAADSKAVGSAFASEYSTSNKYAKNDICLYDGELYRSIEDQLTPGVFNESKWKKLSVGELGSELSKTQDEFWGVNKLINCTPPLGFLEGYIRATTYQSYEPGSFLRTTNASCTDYIEIPPIVDKAICYSCGTSSVAVIAFYDENKTYLPDYTKAGDGNYFRIVKTSIPNGAKYVRFSSFSAIGQVYDFGCWLGVNDAYVKKTFFQYVSNNPINVNSCWNSRSIKEATETGLKIKATGANNTTFGCVISVGGVSNPYDDGEDLHAIYLHVSGLVSGLLADNFVGWRLVVTTSGNTVIKTFNFTSDSYSVVSFLPPHTSVFLQIVCRTNPTNEEYFTFENLEYIDLSNAFGVGNEPDLETFERFYPTPHYHNDYISAYGLDRFSVTSQQVKKSVGGFGNNLLPMVYGFSSGYNLHGITATINDDLSVTFNGTADATAYFNFISGSAAFKLKAGSYICSGLSSGSRETYTMFFGVTSKPFGDREAVSLSTGFVYGGNKAILTTTQDGYLRCNFTVYNGTTLNNVTVYPMITTSDLDGDYTSPYLSRNTMKDVAESSQYIHVSGPISGKIKESIMYLKQGWEPLKDIMYKQTKDGDIQTYPEGSELVGVLYSGMIQEGRDVFFNRTPATFYSSLMNPASTMYQPPVTWGSYQKGNYGALCGSFAGWLFGNKVYYGTSEMIAHGFKVYDYQGPRSIEIGDCLLSPNVDTHIIVVYDIIVNKNSFEPVYICTVEQSFNRWTWTRIWSIPDFEARLNESDWCIGRFEGQEIREPKPIRYATDIIPDMGDQTYYYVGDEIQLYLADGKTRFYYRKLGDSAFIGVNVSSLVRTHYNGVDVYEASALFSEAGTYELTTDISNNTYCLLTVVNKGDAVVDDVTIPVSGDYGFGSGELSDLDDFCTPAYGIVCAGPLEGEKLGTRWPSPTDDNVYYDKVINSEFELTKNGDRYTFNFTFPKVVSGNAVTDVYVRIYFETGFGQGYVDSAYPWQ